MRVAASPPPSSSLLDNPLHQQPDSPCVSAGCVGEHQVLDGIIIIPSIQCSCFPVSSSRASSLLRPTVSLQAPAMCALSPGSWMAVFRVDVHPPVYLIINLSFYFSSPRPLLGVRWRCITNPAAASVIARAGKRRELDGGCGWERTGRVNTATLQPSLVSHRAAATRWRSYEASGLS